MSNSLMQETCVYPPAVLDRPFVDQVVTPRMYKTARFRLHKSDNRLKEPFGSGSGGKKMEEGNGRAPQSGIWDGLRDRDTLCLPDFDQEEVIHAGDEGYTDTLRHYFSVAESNAAEQLVKLKYRLRDASTYDFWRILMEEMCEITGSQLGVVAKRILVDDHESAVEMPPLGATGSCLMGVAFYLNHQGNKELFRDYRYQAVGTPCAHMRHEKVLIIPEKMANFVPDNPNVGPWKDIQSYIGVPLFVDGKCFAHFSLMCTAEGLKRRKLSWNFIETFMHSLEDVIVQRIMEGRSFGKEANTELPSANIIPLAAIAASQSLKPYARSLSHEFRTPLQGVVGMLDIMYSTVVEAIATSNNVMSNSVLEDMKKYIETVQDSSKRAVEAADNVVHAYDLNMQMPETPLTPKSMTASLPTISKPLSPEPVRHAQHQRHHSSPVGSKRPRDEESDYHAGPPLKHPTASPLGVARFISTEASTGARSIAALPVQSHLVQPERDQNLITAPGASVRRRVNIRGSMQNLIYESLRACHPIRELHTATVLGETHEFDSCGSRGELQTRTMQLNIEDDIPDLVLINEQYLLFSLQKLVDNAIKFTECGTISVNLKLGEGATVLEIWITDTGCGIKMESQEHIFEPHFQQDSSISRARDGLGLSLFNAKAQIRKSFGGDITLERSQTAGPTRGSEFLIRLPIFLEDVGGFEMHAVGQPPPHSRSRRPTPRPRSNPSSYSDVTLVDSLPMPSLTVTLRGPLKPFDGTNFNANLAKEYPLNFLIAEDNMINRKVVIGCLKRLGYGEDNMTVAFNGLEAVNEYQASLDRHSQPKYDAILMDIWMPIMDGYEATRHILKLAETAGEKTTILAVTADITEQCTEKAKDVGMQGFLPKPFKMIDMEKLIVENFPKATTNGHA